MKNYKILITNVYTYLNKGDAAIVISLIREVERAFGKQIAIQTTDVINDRGKYGKPVSPTLLWLLLSAVKNRSMPVRLLTLMGGLLRIAIFVSFYRLRIKAYWILNKSLRIYINDIEEADLVIACGGGYLRTSDKSLENFILLTVTCVNFLTGHFLNKKVYLYSQSIGPVYGMMQEKLLRYTLNHVDLVQPREEISQRYLADLKTKSPIIPTADAALLLGDYGSKSNKYFVKSRDKMIVGLTVRKWFKNEKDFNHYLDSVASTVDYLAKKYNADIFYIPQVIAKKFGDDDRETANKLAKKIKYRNSFHVIEDDLVVKDIIGLCGNSHIFIGTRMHSNIFALVNEVPVVAIEYEHKTRGIMIGLGLEDMIVDIKNISFDLLKTKVDHLIAHRDEYSKLIHKNLPAQIAISRYAVDSIKEEYERTR